MTIEIVVVLMAVLIVGVLAGFFALFAKLSQPAPNPEPRLAELTRELNDLKTKQLEANTKALSEQQQLFLQTQAALRQQLDSLQKTMNETLNATQGNLNQRLGESTKVIQDIQTKLGSLEAAAKNIQEIGKDIASLQNILRAPKLRGELGEYLLESFLKDVLPADKFALQHAFRNGQKVDAVIKIDARLVPVDSKFPLESFQRLQAATTEAEKTRARREFEASIRARVDEIARSYIQPDEGTYEFALMYVPAENVYYELVVNRDPNASPDADLLHYAWGKKVIPVSPNSFYAYLMMIVYGLRGLQIEKEAKEIQAKLGGLQVQFQKFFADYELVGKHLGNAKTKYDDTVKKAELFNQKLNQITKAQLELPSGGDS